MAQAAMTMAMIKSEMIVCFIDRSLGLFFIYRHSLFRGGRIRI
jgi:hypothetical protein